MKQTVIEVKDLSFRYGDNLVLEHINFNVQAGEFIGIIGPNAGGKSTLLKILLGLLPVQQGQVRILGRDPKKARRHIGYVPQYPPFQRQFPITVAQLVLMGRLGQKKLWGNYTAKDRQIAAQAMQDTEVLELADRPIAQLSGGQLQRVLVARALAIEPQIMLLDEPTANIDMRLESEIFDLLKKLNERMTILVVSHDIAFISHYVHKVACLNRSLVCHDTAKIDGQTIQSLYHHQVRMVKHV